MTFESGTAFILLKCEWQNKGEPTEWAVGCDAANDTDESMLAHLKHWSPEAEYLGVRIERDSDGSVVLDTQRSDVGPIHRSLAGEGD